MRKVSFVVVAVFCCALPCLAKIGTIDRVPASTLLFPYFEVDPTNPNGVTTVLGIQNASATAMLLNVTLWTDYGLPTAHFMIYLTGYDVQTIDLYDFFVNGQAPVTASDGQDPTDTISPQGNFSQDINFGPSCAGVLPPGQVFGPELLAAHSGGPSVEYFGGNCGSKNYGDGRLRGYITVDTTNSCTSMTPASAGYSGVLTF